MNYDTLAVRKVLSDIFGRNKVDVYLSGIPDSNFEASEYGFMYFSVDKNRNYFEEGIAGKSSA